jgi:AraC family ethanolamine operon transcriptional activator
MTGDSALQFAQRTRFEDSDQLASSFRMADLEIIRRSPGPFRGEIDLGFLNSTVIQFVSFNQTSLSRAWNQFGRFALLVQLRAPRPCVWNGHEAIGSRVITYGPGGEHTGVEPGEMECAVISFPVEHTQPWLEQAPRSCVGRLTQSCHAIEIPPADFGILHWRLLQLRIILTRHPELLAMNGIRSSFDALLEDSLSTVVGAEIMPRLRRREPTRAELLDTIRRFEEYVESNLQQPLSATAICRTLGIDLWVLRRACREFFRLQPDQYLNYLHLTRVRQTLLLGGTESVESIAARWGFWSSWLLRFKYRRLFGEDPQTTLERARRER